jgi:hypothetical protein
MSIIIIIIIIIIITTTPNLIPVLRVSGPRGALASDHRDGGLWRGGGLLDLCIIIISSSSIIISIIIIITIMIATLSNRCFRHTQDREELLRVTIATAAYGVAVACSIFILQLTARSGFWAADQETIPRVRILEMNALCDSESVGIIHHGRYRRQCELYTIFFFSSSARYLSFSLERGQASGRRIRRPFHG